jgi:hypothetical protein
MEEVEFGSFGFPGDPLSGLAPVFFEKAFSGDASKGEVHVS